MHRFAMIALSLCLLLGPTGAHRLFAQEDSKKDEASKPEPAKTDSTQAESPKDKEQEKAKDKEQEKEKTKDATPKPDASAATEAPLPPIPPAVEAKLEAARHAVAEAIVAAQEAGLVKTTIDPPPILDILVTGRALDENTLKAKTGVSPEVFGAWFTGYGTTQDINPQKDVRIMNPSAGLKEFYSQRANLLNRHLEAVRKAHGGAAKEPAPDNAKKGDETGKDAPDEAKKDSDGSKPAKDDAKKDDNPGDGSTGKDDTAK